MSEIVKLRTRAEIDEEAAAWVWRLDSETVSPADRRAFESWLGRDVRHRRSIDELAAVWRSFDELAGARRGGTPVRYAQRAVGCAAAAVLALAAAGVLWLRHEAVDVQTVATAVGQRRSVTLADGSVIALNTNTILETRLNRQVRDVYLRQGEAHFRVAHDRQRPFVVHAGDAAVRAVGTQFEIRVHADRHVDVVVNEGRVEVQAEAAPPGSAGVTSPIRARARPIVRGVGAGEQLSTASANYPVIPVSADVMSSEMAWRDGAIVFDGESLSEAVTDIERYTDARIVINDPRVAALRVGGRFRTDDLPGLLAALESALPVTIRRSPDGRVIIDARR